MASTTSEPRIGFSRALIGEPPSGGFFLGIIASTGKPFFLRGDALDEHLHIPGKSRSGKSNFLELLAVQMAMMPPEEGGCTLIDVDGSLADAVVSKSAKYRLYKNRPVYVIEAGSDAYAPAIDALYVPPGADKQVVATSFATLVSQSWGEDGHATPMIRSTLRHLGVALIELGLPLTSCGVLLWDEEGKAARRKLVAKLTTKSTRRFFEDLDALPPARRNEVLGGAARRLEEFLSSPYTRRMFAQCGRGLDFARAMDEGAVIVIKLVPDGIKLSQDDASLIAALCLNQIYLAGFRRKKRHKRHWVICDECSAYMTDVVALGLDRSRKYGIRFIFAHQHLYQPRAAGEHIYGALMTNPGGRIIFGGLSTEDATIMGELAFRGYFDLERPKKKLIRSVAVGVELATLNSHSQTESRARQQGWNWSAGESHAHALSETLSAQVTRSVAETESESDTHSTAHTDTIGGSRTVTQGENWGTAETESENETENESWDYDRQGFAALPNGYHQGASKGSGRSTSQNHGGNTSVAETENWASAGTIGDAHMTGRSLTKGTAAALGAALSLGVTDTRTSSRGGSLATTDGSAASHGTAETFKPVYAETVTDTYSLQELIHMAAVSIANTPPGVCFIRIGSRRPRRIITPFLGDDEACPPLMERVTLMLQGQTPCNTPVAIVEEEMRAREQWLAALAPPSGKRTRTHDEPDEEDDDPNDEEGWRRLAEGKKP